VNDIKNHRWFKPCDWHKVYCKKLPATYIPKIEKPGDTSNFTEYPDSDKESPPVDKKADPFIDW